MSHTFSKFDHLKSKTGCIWKQLQLSSESLEMKQIKFFVGSSSNKLTFCSVKGLPGGFVWKAGSSGVWAPLSETHWGGTPPAGSKSDPEPSRLTATPPKPPQTPHQEDLTQEYFNHSGIRIQKDFKLFWLFLLTWQVHVGGPVSSLVLEGADPPTMKGAVFSGCIIIIIRKHCQEATRER